MNVDLKEISHPTPEFLWSKLLSHTLEVGVMDACFSKLHILTSLFLLAVLDDSPGEWSTVTDSPMSA